MQALISAIKNNNEQLRATRSTVTHPARTLTSVVYTRCTALRRRWLPSVPVGDFEAELGERVSTRALPAPPRAEGDDGCRWRGGGLGAGGGRRLAGGRCVT